MSGPSLCLSTMLGALEAISSGASGSRSLAAYGLTDTEWDLATGKNAWVGGDRQIVRRALEALTYGSIDVVGLPRFDIPAEYVAAVIAHFVAPINMLVACNFMSGVMPTTDTLHTRAEPENISASHLLSLVSLAKSADLVKFQRRFEEMVGRQLAHLVPDVALPPEEQLPE